MRTLFFCLAIFVISKSAYPLNVSLGFFKQNDSVQDSSGADDSNPFSPSLSFGHVFNLWGQLFSPHIGYIQHTVKNNDPYGGDYDKTTIYLLYDFLWEPFANLGGGTGTGFSDFNTTGYKGKFALRIGLGNFIQSFKGRGGTVDVPNGSNGTSTAFRPGRSKKSYVGSLNLGMEFNGTLISSGLTNWGGRLHLFFFSPLQEEKRSTAMRIGFNYIF